MIKFADGVEFTDEQIRGPLHWIEKHDGVYVVGKGMILLMITIEEAEKFIEENK